jgi:hypothetical protein
MNDDGIIQQVKNAKRLLNWATLASILGVAIFPALFNTPRLLIATVALLIVCVPFQVYSVLRFAQLTEMGKAGKAFYSLGMFFPGISFFLLLTLRGKAQGILKKANAEEAPKMEQSEQLPETEEAPDAGTALTSDDIPGEEPEKDEKPSRLPLGCAVASFVVLALVLGPLTVFMVDFYSGFNRVKADRSAFSDMSKLEAAIERFRNEQVNINCPEPLKLTSDSLQYLVGPYYGWAGTNKEYEVKIRVVGNEVWGCSPKGRIYDNDERMIYRIQLESGPDLPSKLGKCTGRTYGGPEGACFLSTAIGDDCKIMRPKESKPCK